MEQISVDQNLSQIYHTLIGCYFVNLTKVFFENEKKTNN